MEKINVGEKIKELREQHQKTQKEVATYLGISEQAYQKYEYDAREPKLFVIRKLALLYNVSADEILGLK